MIVFRRDHVNEYFIDGPAHSSVIAFACKACFTNTCLVTRPNLQTVAVYRFYFHCCSEQFEKFLIWLSPVKGLRRPPLALTWRGPACTCSVVAGLSEVVRQLPQSQLPWLIALAWPFCTRPPIFLASLMCNVELALNIDKLLTLLASFLQTTSPVKVCTVHTAYCTSQITLLPNLTPKFLFC